MELLSDLVRTDDVLFVVRSSPGGGSRSGGKDGSTAAAVVGEIRSGPSLGIRKKDKWITIGSNEDPAHMHINSELVRTAEFVQEDRPQGRRSSFSVRFFDASGGRILAAFFTKMYDGESDTPISGRLEAYERLRDRYPAPKISF